jgi:ATPase subunit of ABC transporter with duplicated ATPase domains
MGHVELTGVGYVLPDGRTLLDDVTFRVGESSTTALIGPNGAGKSTVLRLVSGELAPHEGSVVRSGTLMAMPQFVAGNLPGAHTVADLLLAVSPVAVRQAAEALDAAEIAMMDRDDEQTQMTYALALAEWGDAGGYDAEVLWDEVCTVALQRPYRTAQYRDLATLSGGEQKRMMLEALLRSDAEVLLLDEPDNYLDVPGKTWLEQVLRETTKAVLLVSHDRELLARAADRIVTLELGAAGSTAWTHGGGFATYAAARDDRLSRLAELRRRWDDKHAQLRRLVLTLRQQAAVSDGMASRYHAAQTRLARFEAEGPPLEVPRPQRVHMRLAGGRTGKRAVICEQLALTGLTTPFDLEVWYGDRVAVLGANGSGKSHFLRLLASCATADADGEAVAHTGVARLGARVRPGLFTQVPGTVGSTGATLLEVLHRGDGHRSGLPQHEAARVLDRYELTRAGHQRFDQLSGGQQARFQILLLELSGATLMLLDEPTDNLDLVSAEALEHGLAQYAGTVVAVTHDRWFARGFDRYVLFGADGSVTEVPEPVWDEPRPAHDPSR